nr:arylamine N-acetyltransferase [uncultured Dongia sp.]
MPDRELDLQAYFDRIGYRAAVAANAAVLQQLHWLHVSSIPFENLDVLLGRPILLDTPALAAKLVAARRGGYCFEQNGLFLAVLRAIGFTAEAFAARVWWARQDASVPPRSHMLLRVDCPDGSYLCDVGFGGLTPVQPLSWRMEIEQPTSHETYRLVTDAVPGELALQARLEEKWATVYSFLPQPAAPADFEVANWYVSTHPGSFFTEAIIATRPFTDGRHVLQDRKVTVRARDRSEQTTTLTGPADLRATLLESYSLALGQADLDVLWARLAPKSGSETA